MVENEEESGLHDYRPVKPGRKGPRPKPTLGDGFAARLGRKIRQAREDRRLTVVEAVERSGKRVGPTSWRSYELGLNVPGLDRYVAICEALGVPLASLLQD